MIDAGKNFNDNLTLETLFGWHNAMFESGYSGVTKIRVAQFRESGEMEVVSGRHGREKIHYKVPPMKWIPKEMERFISWFNKSPETLEKSAIAHLWFVIIHPFDDGNGRIARALSDRALSRVERLSFKIYTMSKCIYEDRKGYYEALDKTTGRFSKADPLDITEWMEWFFATLLRALQNAHTDLGYIVEKTRFWDKHRDSNLNERQVKVLNRLLDIGSENFKGDLTKSKYIKIAKTADTNASRDIADLLAKGCIKQVGGTTGRGTKYTINHNSDEAI